MSASKNTYEWNLIQSKGQQYEPHPFDLLSLHPRSINPLLLEMNTNTPRTDVCLQKLIQELTCPKCLAEMTNNSTESNKNADSGFNKNMTPNTPRTDAAIELYGERPFMVSAVPVKFAQQLERELTESQAQSHGLARRVVEAETKLEIVERDLAALKRKSNEL